MSEQRFQAIAAQYQVSPIQLIAASQNASKSVTNIDSDEWFDVFAASLDSFEEENAKQGLRV